MQELRHDVRSPIRARIHVIHADDVGMREHARRLRFALEARHDLRLARELMMQELHGEALGVQPRVPRLVDPAHAALADHAQDLVRAVEQLAHDRIFVVRRVRERRGVPGADSKISGVARSAGGAHARIDRCQAALWTPSRGHGFEPGYHGLGRNETSWGNRPRV